MKKIYYSIGEVADELGEKQSTLRYWESEFNDLNPRRSTGGRRLYTEEDIQLLKRIKYLLHVAKFSIEGARKKLKGENTFMNIIERLEKIKRSLEE